MRKQHSSIIGGLVASAFTLTVLFVPCMVHAQVQSDMNMSLGHNMQVASGADVMSCCRMGGEHRELVAIQSASESTIAKVASSNVSVHVPPMQAGSSPIPSDFPIAYRSRDPSYLMVFRC